MLALNSPSQNSSSKVAEARSGLTPAVRHLVPLPPAHRELWETLQSVPKETQGNWGWEGEEEGKVVYVSTSEGVVSSHGFLGRRRPPAWSCRCLQLGMTSSNVGFQRVICILCWDKVSLGFLLLLQQITTNVKATNKPRLFQSFCGSEV